MLDKNKSGCSLPKELSLNPLQNNGTRIPTKFLNAIDFINYNHYGDFPWTSRDEENEDVFLSPEYKRVTHLLGIDCEMVGVRKNQSALGRVSIVNEYGYCIYDTFVNPQEEITDYRTKYSGIRPEDLVNAPATDLVLKKVAETVHDKILIGHAIHNDLEILKLKNHEKIRDTSLYFKIEFNYTPSLKELAKTLLNFDIQTGEHSSIQDAQATLKLYLKYREKWETDIIEGRRNANLPDNFGFGKIVKNISEMHVEPRESDLFEDPKNIFLRENKVVGAYSSCEEYLDVQFRLLLEDFLRPLRDGVKNINQLFKNPKAGLFHDVRVSIREEDDLEVDVKGYLNLRIPIVRNHLVDTDWKETKIFLNGSLLLLTLDNFKSVKFAVITYRSEDPAGLDFVTMKVKFLKDGLTWIINSDTKFLMMESPAFYEAYKHSLKHLQTVTLKNFPMKKYIVDGETTPSPPSYLRSVTKELDFSVLLKNNQENSSNLKMAKPLDLNNWPKANDLNFDASQYEAFSKALTQELTIIQGPPGTGKTFIGIQIVKLLLSNSWLLVDSPILIVSQRNHSLDQALEMILDFLTNALCAGNKKKAETMILRVGGCSKSDVVQPLTLYYKSIVKFREKILTDKCNSLEKPIYGFSELHFNSLLFEQGLLDFQKLPLEILQNISTQENYATTFTKWRNIDNEMRKDPLKWFGIQSHLTGNKIPKKNPELKHTRGLFLILFQQYDISWPTYLLKLQENILSNSIENFYPLPDIQLEVEGGLKITDYATRWTYYLLLVKGVKEIVEDINKKINDVRQEYLDAEKSIISRGQCIKLAKVIGMTTTGAVKHKGIVLQAKPKIMIVEEAAHVLKAHVVASLTQYCQQMVLIGDHKQLRPLTADYNLATDYSLDVSLMERLVANGMAQGVENYTQLKVQHRMRPEIARMICPVIYEELDNHPDVYNYPDVRGCSKNLFFVDHGNPERKERGSRSYFNEYEATFVCGLVKYFIKGGYCHLSQISIIATYSAQKILIENELKSDQDKSYSQVRVSTVDGYQGEENDIIILSLVRNNDQGNVGFLKTNNRVCVALSRARHGLFMIGNMSILKEQSGTWEKVNSALEEMHCIGDSLPLTGSGFMMEPLTVKASNLFARPQYPNQNSQNMLKLNNRKATKDFPPVQEKNVNNIQLLKCGHSQALTERQMKNVSAVKCTTTVEKELACGHQHRAHCHQTTGFICSRTVKKKLACGHQMKVACYQEPSNVKCTKIVVKKLVCGHLHRFNCHQTESHIKSIKCSVTFNLSLPCGHQKKVPCHEKSQATCNLLIKKVLACGHEIELSCCDKVPEKCTVTVESTLQCGHLQEHPCHLVDKVKCCMKISRTLSCGHIQEIVCSESNSEIQCKTLMVSKCEHKVEMECHAAAKNGSRYCDSKCEKMFKCGHQCSLLCHDKNKHSQYECVEKCRRSCTNGHPCPTNHECFRYCPMKSKNGCLVVVSSCSHRVIKCQDVTNGKVPACKIRCQKIFRCGHQCRFLCHDHEKDDLKHSHYKCIENCQRSCPHDHPCPEKHSCYLYCPLTSKRSNANGFEAINCLVCRKIRKTLKGAWVIKTKNSDGDPMEESEE